MKWVLAVTVLALGAPVWAADENDPAEDSTPRRELRVLHDPYDIASFYRHGATPPAAPRYQDDEGRITIDPRSISSFYRSDTPSGVGHRSWRLYRIRSSRDYYR